MRLAVLMLFAAVPLCGQAAPPADGRWVLAGDSTRRGQFDGRDAISMYTGSATRRDLVLQDGTIDVDVRTTRRRSFVYLRFRIEDEDNAEEFYLRPHKSELPDAVQYARCSTGRAPGSSIMASAGRQRRQSIPVHGRTFAWCSPARAPRSSSVIR